MPTVLRKSRRQLLCHCNGTVLPAGTAKANRKMRLPLILMCGQQEINERFYLGKECRKPWVCRHIFGNGTYFARDASYSDSGYARTLPSGQKQMLVVDVLVGRSTPGQQGMTMCPLLPGEQYTRYNPLVNKVVNPSIFVVQHSNQAYPAYLITYRA